ncbi:hypothetical protein ACIQXA_08470 [Streptomyces massasporeus]|uniref:hypothetical protein n=1 Tax=Streptomyces massasporeus TaxID=67324 RepID=UPI0037FE0E05
MLTLKIQQMTVDGHPYTCPECLSEAFTLDGTGFLDAMPVRGNCWQSHSWEEPLITLGDLKRINEASTGRERAEDDDTFEIVIGGALIAGILHPDVTLDDLKQAWKRVYWGRLLKPALRQQKNQAKRAITRPIKKAARNSVAVVKAGALEAAWTAQAGGYEADPDYTPEPVNACPACDGNGEHRIESRLHSTTRIRCSVCSGTGEID